MLGYYFQGFPIKNEDKAAYRYFHRFGTVKLTYMGISQQASLLFHSILPIALPRLRLNPCLVSQLWVCFRLSIARSDEPLRRAVRQQAFAYRAEGIQFTLAGAGRTAQFDALRLLVP